MLYKQIADILLQLSKLSLPAVGSVEQVDDFTWEVTRRPLLLNMNELVRLGTLPRAKLPNTVFKTASSYFEALAQLHIDNLTHQRNDAIESSDECRRKFVSRHLFRKLSREGRLTFSRNDNGPFRIWCDDFRPGNVLLNENLQIVGVVDWEFTYAAPSELSLAPPWWLLLEQPEYWPGGLEAWTEVYESHLRTFLKVLVARRDAAISSGRLREDQRLSGRMRESWNSGDFWVSYAARKNFAFDAVFWQKLDRRFFGPNTNADDDKKWKERIDLLDEAETEYMEPFVNRKLEEMKERVLTWDPDEFVLN